MYDALIAGAGPAGSVAAIVLARAGARVLVIDRARFPRDKLCGDTVNPGALAILRRLGLAGDVEARALPVDGMVVTGARGVRVQAAYGGGARGLAILRRDLDASLLRAAVAAGVRVEEGVLVRSALVDEQHGVRVRGLVIAGRDGRDLRVPAPFVIAADGRRSRVAIGLGLLRHPARPRRWAIGAYFDRVADVTSFGEMHVRSGQYLGVAPVPSGLTNVCLVIPRRPGIAAPGDLLQRAIGGDPALQERFRDARLAGPPVVLGPLAVDASSAGVPGLLLAGDAAGFIDPMTGDGLRFAIRGAELAAEVALASLAGALADPYLRLAQLRCREFGQKWRFNRSVRQLVSRGFAVNLAGLVASAAPGLLRRMIAFAGDVPKP